MTSRRFERLEETLARVAEQQAENTTAIAELRRRQEADREEMVELRSSVSDLRSSVSELRSSVAEIRATAVALLEIAELHQSKFEVYERRFQDTLSEIRGLRTETQRLIEHVFRDPDHEQPGD